MLKLNRERENLMKTKVCMLLICLFALTTLALAQAKVDGKWSATIEGGRRGPQMVTITLKSEAGGKLSGSVDAGGRGGPVNIEEGTISGNTIKFKQKQMGRGGEVVINYTGTLSGDEIKFTRMQEGGQGMPVEFTAKRAQ
jgi:hypothetical protein